MATIISHVAIINKPGKILILRRSLADKVFPGFWDLPGGTNRLKEGPVEAAIREAEEECGLIVSDLRPLTCLSNWDKNKREKFVTIIFICKKYKGKIKLNLKDHDDYSWVDMGDLKNIKAVEYLKGVEKLIKSSYEHF